VGGIVCVTLGIGVLDAVLVCVTVGARSVGVAVTGKRGSNVMVGTGDERAACSVDMRSRGLPVAGISVMICFRMFLLIKGTSRSCGSPL
jgi:hypothetical protein